MCNGNLFRALLISLFIFSVSANPARTQPLDKQEQINKLFKDGKDYYESGRYIKAAQAFEMILKLNPSSQTAARLRREAGEEYFIKMMRNEEMRLPVEKLHKLAYLWEKRRRRNPKYIERFIKELMSEDPERRSRGMFQILHAGHFAIPYLVKYLKDEQLEMGMRTTAKITIEKMGKEAVLSLIEMLNSKNELMLENSALILGSIKDDRALPALKRVWDSPETPVVAKKYIAQAIRQITGKRPEQLSKSPEYYYAIAERYLLEGPAVQDEAMMMEGVIWKYREGDTLEPLNIMEQKTVDFVPAVDVYSWNEYLAEENCYDAITVQPDYEKIIPMLLCVYFAQVNEVNMLLKQAEVLKEAGVITTQDEEELNLRAERLKRVTLIGRLCGKKYLNRALNIALNDNLPNVAASLIQTLKIVDDGSLIPGPDFKLGDPKKPEKKSNKKSTEKKEPTGIVKYNGLEGYPLSRALTSKDDRVAYEAAITCAHINRETPYLNSEKVVSILAKAVGEKGTISILVVDDDLQRNNILCNRLRSLGFLVVSARSGLEGKYLAKSPPVKDLILLASSLKDVMPERLIVNFSADFSTRYTPVAILSKKEKEEAQRKRFDDFNVANYIFSSEADQAIVEKIRQAVEKNENRLASKADKQALSARAAQALAAINVKHTPLKITEAIPALIQVLETKRIDAIRNPALVALGNFQAKEALDVILRTFRDKGNARPIRLNCLRAVGMINPAETEALKVLRDALNEEDFDINKQASIAIGKADLKPEQITETLVDQRIVKKLK